MLPARAKHLRTKRDSAGRGGGVLLGDRGLAAARGRRPTCVRTHEARLPGLNASPAGHSGPARADLPTCQQKYSAERRARTEREVPPEAALPRAVGGLP